MLHCAFRRDLPHEPQKRQNDLGHPVSEDETGREQVGRHHRSFSPAGEVYRPT